MTEPLAVLLDTCAVIWFANGAPLPTATVSAIVYAGLNDGIFVSITFSMGNRSAKQAETGAATGVAMPAGR
jgi:hypothetical protein